MQLRYRPVLASVDRRHAGRGLRHHRRDAAPFPTPNAPGPAALPPPRQPPSPLPPRSGPRTDRLQRVGTALALRGAPYRNGGSDPSGFDCSGFVRYVFARTA